MPLLRTHATSSGIRLELGTWAYGNGRTLTEAADDLVDRLTAMAMAVRGGRLWFTSEMPPIERAQLDLLWALGEAMDRPDGVRSLIFGTGPTAQD